MASSTNAIGIFIVCFLILFSIQLFYPCIRDSVSGIDSGLACINQNEVTEFFNSVNAVFEDVPIFNVIISVFTGFFNILAALIQTMTWGIGISAAINIMLIPVRIIALVCIYYIVFPTK
jgi:hypothetical protein